MNFSLYFHFSGNMSKTLLKRNISEIYYHKDDKDIGFAIMILLLMLNWPIKMGKASFSQQCIKTLQIFLL